MVPTYKTPGVYVEEIPTLPPSVAEVETAIPVFIGYTERAVRNGESLTNKPTAVASLTEYNAAFGAGPASAFNVFLDGSNNVSAVASTVTYYMYESLRLFFENGGGKCYVISVGSYSTNSGPRIGPLAAALDILAGEDEPTLILSPDAVLCPGPTDLYSFQTKALLQAAKIGNRFVVCDLLPSDEGVAGKRLADRVQDFRNNIGIDNLKYGAAYTPYIYSALPREIRFCDINLYKGPPPPAGTAPATPSITLDSLTTDAGILQLIYDLNNAVKADKYLADLSAPLTGTPAIPPTLLTGTNERFEDQYKSLLATYITTPTLANLQPVYDLTVTILNALGDFQATLPAEPLVAPPSRTTSAAFLLKTDIRALVASSGVVTAFTCLIQNFNAMKAVAGTEVLFTGDPAKALALTGVAAGVADAVVIGPAYAEAANEAARLALAKNAITATYPSILSFFYSVQTAARSYETTLDNNLSNAFGLYKNILSKISMVRPQLPPSGAVVGIYAMIDHLRGVWKAPANVSLSSVIGPVTNIDDLLQDSLNVDPNAGKSINAIRAFTGKGTLIFGARTLAGNDNEWRYVSVRRTFSMVEESVKRSTGLLVFEPNDDTTWVKVRGMIDNFLTNLWRKGALAGAKPEQAFYVKVGLGQTMTAQDILEGLMIVQIGMAVVRPAEFIILQFTQKMQES